jgi:osmotically-inducible protein OsmY
MTLPVLAIAAALLAAGCSQQTISSAQQDVKHDVAVVDQKANQAAQDVRPQASKLDVGARVTTALQVNPNLPHSIRVDAGSDGVRLRGSVRTAQQKQLATHIAKETVPAGMTVTNELSVKPSG